ncbi:MAG: AIR synthase family protein [Clostridiales Family XIII bacterium]|nr:AIR synthase family protein [Clostridia bacterium]MDE8731950.1 AIR synthase family protein [Eubacteriales bacterium DFI.9.88]MDY3013193.1 AIR synthase family protein [Clostridiales Family XIII bacterium]
MLKTGKLDSELLEKIVFNNIKFKRPEVLTRPGIGEDCAVVDFGSYECIMSTDPITAAISEIGRLSIHISCNDIASNGIQPLGIMLAVMLPVGTTEEQIEEMMRQAGEASEELGVEIIGGHTEITPAVTKPVIVSTAIGRGEKWASQHSENMRPGDLIMITKSAGLEGSGIIACDFEEQLQKVLTHEEIEKAKSLLGKVSVVKEGVAAGKVGTHGMHDVTEGGVLGAVWEMCQIAGTGAELWVDQVPVEPVTRKICDYFDIDYLRLISSGCMIIMVAPDKKEEMAEAMKAAGVEASYIGVIKDSSAGICMNVDGELIEIAPPASDELYKVVGEES